MPIPLSFGLLTYRAKGQCRIVFRLTKQLVTCCHIKIQFSCKLRLEIHHFQFNDDIAAKTNMIEQQIREVTFVANHEFRLPSDEREATSKFKQKNE